MKKLLRMKLGSEGDPVRIWNMVKPSDDIASMGNAQFLEIVGEYRDYRWTHLQILELISREIALHFPDRICHTLSISDAGSRSGICPNHPTHSESRCLSADIQFYTRNWPNNRTGNGENWISVWDADGKVNDYFDRERNALLVKLLYEAFPGIGSQSPDGSVPILLCSDLKNVLVEQAKIMWPAEPWPYPIPNPNREEWRDVERGIQAEDTNPGHRDHMHTYVGKEVNWEMVI